MHTHTQTVSITQPSAGLNANISSQINVACHGNSTGAASVTVSGGTTPYTYSWSTTPAQSNAQATSLSAGSYAVTITDAKNCTTSAAVNITEPATNVSAMINNQTNVSCFGFNNGSATVLASGGVPAYTYNWNSVPSQTTATAANLPAGTYNVMVKDANNCSYSIQTIITQPTASLSANVSSQSNVLCYNEKTGSATIVANGGTSPYTYSWSTTPIQTSATATNLGAGIYTVTVKDANVCTITKTVSISQPTSAVTASISSQNNVLCFGASSATAAVVANGGVGAYTYNWSSIPTQTTSIATNLAAGNYTVTVRDANNCMALASVNISQPTTALSANITSILNVKCKTNATGAATVVANGGSGSYSYLWNSSPTQTTSVASGLIAGNYTVTVTDNNGCIVPVTKTITITEPAAILNATSLSPLFNGNHISCFGGNNGSINLSPTGGTTAYAFSWTGPSGFTSTSEDINTLIAGTYTVLITDANACTKTYTSTLTQPTLLNLSSTVTPATCPSFNDGAITLVVSGGTTAYNYSWSGPSSFTATTASISGLVAGNYSLTVTDANGCIKSSVYTVTQPGAIVITNTVSSFTGGKNISCYGYNDGAIGSVNVTGGTPIYTYLWTGPSSFTSTTANISGLYAGNYQLVVTDNAGCVANKLITLSQPNAITNTLTPSVFAGNYNINCFGTSTGSLTSLSNGGTPAYTYSWSGPSSYTATTQNINALVSGTYTLTVTDVNTCVGTNTITLTQPNALVTGITSPTVAGGYNITCNGLSNGQINLTNTGGTPNYSYVWSGPSSYTSTTQNPNNIIAGNYSVVLTDANGCVTSNSITLTQPNTLVAAASSPTVNGAYNITCYGNNNGTINLNVNGGTSAFTYAWTGTGAYTGSSQNPSGLVAGIYQVLVTDANNCTATTNITLTQPTLFTSSVSSPTFIGNNNISCNGLLDGAINLSVNGGTSAYSYAWTGPSTYTSNIQNPTGLQAGVYHVTATDANGCVTSSSITLTEPAAMSVNVNSPTFAGGYNISCNGFTNGSINLTNGGGIPNYSYNWSGPSSYTSSVQSPTGLTAGVYSVSIIDANTCSISSIITLTEPTSLTGSITSPTVNGGYNITCNGANNGVITQTLSGGTLPYSIIWNNGLTTQDVNNIGAGSYSVIITDANNCSINQSIVLTEPETVFASANSPSFYGGYNIKCHSNSTGTISLGAIGGTTPYTYNWNGPSSFTSSTQNLNNVNAGTYTATVTDMNNCSYTTIITLTEPAVLASSVSSYTFIGGNNISCHGFNDGAITSTVSGGTQSYQYNWVGPLGFTSSSQNLNSLVVGSYTLTVTDTNNCVTNNTITLLEPSVLTATLNSGTFVGGYNISCNGNNDGSINVNVAGGTSSYSYLWTASNSYTSSAQNINTLYAGNYSVTVTDANNCMVNLSQSLTEPTALKDTMVVSEFLGGYNLSCFNSNNGTVQLTTTGGTNPYTQVWTGPSSFTSSLTSISNLAAGSYSVLITDANGCVKTETITLAQPSVISQSLSTTSYVGGVNIRCKGDSTGVVYNTIDGGTPGYNYQWFGPAGFTATTKDIYEIISGTYTVVATDTNGCVNSSTISIIEPAVTLTASLNVNNVDCNGNSTGNISISVNGGSPGYNYWWRGPNNYTSFNQNLNGLYSGLYDVVVTDTNGCQIFIDTVITEPAILTHTYSAINPVCKGVANGSIDLSIIGGTNPYTFNWSNGTTTEDLSNISAGTYTVMYLDVHNCSNTATITITEPEQILSIDKTVTPIKCYHDANSSIALTVNGGTAPYSYSWSNGASTQNLFNLGAGNYTVTVVDSFGCVLNDVTIISQPDSLYLNIYSPLQFNGHHVSLAGSNDGLIDLTVNGGTTPFSYIWSNGNTTEDLNNITAGFYNVIVIDTNGCKASASIILTEPFVLELPTGFSPNGDGKNDLFVIHGIESYPDNTVTIYNRWGNVVYSTANYTNDWNGNSNNGQALPDATYFVILEINKGEIVKKNYVELRR